MTPTRPLRTSTIAPLGVARPSTSSVRSFPSRSNAPPLTVSTDTGIYIDHPDFEGRASWGKTFGGYDDKDGNGHGTHCAGTAVSNHYGVAKAAKVIAVKVLSDSGSGAISDV